MITYTYHARDEQGRMVKGVLEAESQPALADRLRTMGYLVTKIEERTFSLPNLGNISFGRKVSEETLLFTSLQLANLVEAGIPLITCLKTIASQTAHPGLRGAFEAVAREVEGGASLSQALTHQSDFFPKLMVSLCAVGEASGHLDTVLNRFANFVEKDLALRRQVQGALLYPALLLIASAMLVLFVVTFVVPQFAALFLKAGISLPLPTQILQAIGEGIRSFWWALGMMGLLLVMGAGAILKIPKVRFYVDAALLHFPVLGNLIHETLVARFARTLGTLVGSGIPILSALETAQGVVGNQVIAEEVTRVRSAVERGERVAATLSVGTVFHPDAIQMIKIGEETGRLDQMLEKIADFYELRVNFHVRQMTTLLEPILLAIMGGVVAFIMASLLLPMFDMVKTLKHGGMR